MKKFTMIELLIIISIIGILASILMPSLQKARNKGMTAVCINNLKQMQYGYSMYVDDNNDILVRNFQGGVIGTGTTEENIKNTSLIYSYVGHPQVYKCPSDPVPASVEAAHAVKSYGFNGYLNDGQTYSIERLSLISSSHNNVMGFIDEAGNVRNGFIRPNSDWMGGWHDKSYNISFMDGHVKNIRLLNNQSWFVVQNMINTGNRDFSSIGGTNPDRVRLLDFMNISD